MLSLDLKHCVEMPRDYHVIIVIVVMQWAFLLGLGSCNKISSKCLQSYESLQTPTFRSIFTLNQPKKGGFI